MIAIRKRPVLSFSLWKKTRTEVAQEDHKFNGNSSRRLTYTGACYVLGKLTSLTVLAGYVSRWPSDLYTVGGETLLTVGTVVWSIHNDDDSIRCGMYEIDEARKVFLYTMASGGDWWLCVQPYTCIQVYVALRGVKKDDNNRVDRCWWWRGASQQLPPELLPVLVQAKRRAEGRRVWMGLA